MATSLEKIRSSKGPLPKVSPWIRKLTKTLSVGKGIESISLVVLSLLFIFPFVWMATTSFKTLPETMLFPPALFPKTWMFENYGEAWRSGPFPTYLLNSIFIAVAIIILQFVVIIPAAYAFAQKQFKGSNVLFGLILLGLMIPTQVTFLPIYLLFSKMGLINTPAALILPFASSSFGIFLLTQNFKQIPNEIIEAAKLDKATELQIVLRIMLPMAKPAILTFALFSFIAHWNDYFWVLTMTNSDAIRTLPVGIVNLKDTESIKSWHVIMAGNMILVAPILAIYTLASKHIKSAFTYSGIK
jgi:sn-glycerol 3-phosphate transport system permease protein